MFSVEVDLRIGSKRFSDAVRGLEFYVRDLQKRVDRLHPILRQELEKYFRGVIAAMQARHSTPWVPDQPGPTGPRQGRLYTRSGDLIGGIDIKSLPVGLNGVGVLSVPFPGIVHELGAGAGGPDSLPAITPKRVKYLTIPLPAALDARGLPIRPSIREWDRTFLIPIAPKEGPRWLVMRRPAGQRKATPLYVLQKVVRIEPRLGMRETINLTVQNLFLDPLVDRMLTTLQES